MATPHPPLCAVILIINDDNQVLVSSRRYNSRMLNLPGGKVDPADVVGPPLLDVHNTLLNCAIREAFEETGIGLEAEDLELLYTNICEHQPDESGEQEPDSIAFTYLALQWSGEPHQREGEPPIRWVEWEDLLQNTPYPRYNQGVREAFIRFLKDSAHE